MWYVSSLAVNPPVNLDQVVSVSREDDRIMAFSSSNHTIKFFPSTTVVPVVWKYANIDLRNKEWDELMTLIQTEKEEPKQRKRTTKKEA